MAVHCLGLTRCFARLQDPRVERARFHLLGDILSLAVLAVIAGAEGWEDIEEFGKQKHAWLKQYLQLPNGIPSHDTIARVFRALRPSVLPSMGIRRSPKTSGNEENHSSSAA